MPIRMTDDPNDPNQDYNDDSGGGGRGPTKTKIITSRSKSGLAVSQKCLNFSLTAAPPQHHPPATAGGAGARSDGRSVRPSCPDRRQKCGC